MKQVIQLILIMFFGTDVCVGGNRSIQRKPTCLTTWPSHMPTPGIKPGRKQWEASVLSLRQSDSYTLEEAVRGECVTTAPVRQLYPGGSSEWQVCYHCASQTDIVTLKQSTMYAYCRVIHFHFSDDDSTQNHWSEHKIERHKSDSCHMYTVCWLNTEKWNCYVLISCNL